MTIRLIGCLILIGAILTPAARSEDPLQCSCDCGAGNSDDDITLNSFISQARGEKGNRGFSGKRGSRGSRGSGGVQGPSGQQGATGPPGSSGSTDGGSVPVMSSCYELRRSGYTENGIYTIRRTNTSSIIRVYCDMEVNGGGWTLVASVHENNIDGKCTFDDNWSDNSNGISNSNSWVNTRVFGSVESATGSDYKNSAYFALPASDVMVWHVPNNNPPSQWSEQASLKYYTNNSFLTQYGGNLRDLYTQHFPMERQTKTSKGIEVDSIVSEIVESSTEILNAIPGFYHYKYDGDKGITPVVTSIEYGGGLMYFAPGGSEVYVRAGSEDWHPVIYGESFTEHPAYNVTNTANRHPFITLMYIGNNDATEETFDIKVKSQTYGYLKYGFGKWTDDDGEFSFGDFNVKFKKYDVYDSYYQRCIFQSCRGKKFMYDTVCEVYFVIYSSQGWNSKVSNETDFFQAIEWSDGARVLVNTMRVSGSPQNVMFGYTLFSNKIGEATDMSGIVSALKVMLQKISPFNPEEELEEIRSSLYDTGSDIYEVFPEFSIYEYDGIIKYIGDGMTSIKNGGNNMYDTGNKVWVRSSSTDPHQVVYGETYTEDNKYRLSSNVNSHPFITLMYIENSDRVDEWFDINVRSTTGYHYVGTTSTYEGDLRDGDFYMKYKTYNVYEVSDHPTICEVYFVVYNFKLWNSVFSDGNDFFQPTQFGADKHSWGLAKKDVSNTMRVNGHPGNILFSYTLFSKENGNVLRSSYIKEAMKIILEKIAKVSTVTESDCSRLDESVVAPVHFHTGTAEDVSEGIPPTQRSETTPGYLQLRAVGPEGFPYAMCPGVKTESCRPSSLCIGGINTLRDHPSICGDFTGYGGLHGDKPTETDADGSARSLNDLNSSIFIFTRDRD